MNQRITIAIGLVAALTASGLPSLQAGQAFEPTVADVGDGSRVSANQRGKGPKSGQITLVELPSLGSNAEARAVNADGTIIAGIAHDKDGLLHAVRWTLQGSTWTIQDLPWPPGAVSAMAHGVNDVGDVVGQSFPSSGAAPPLWPLAGGVGVLGCAGDAGSAQAISATGQIAVGHAVGQGGALWRPGSCVEHLPPLFDGLGASAHAVNGDGTVVGGQAKTTDGPDGGFVPVRWRHLAGQWIVEPLDTLLGIARGANAAGDLAGHVSLPCGSENDCQRAVIWYVGGGYRQLGTLGGDYSSAFDINANGETAGVSTSSGGGATPFFWSESTGMVPLPFKGHGAVAWALSSVRSDGTRLVVGMQGGRGRATAWVIGGQ